MLLCVYAATRRGIAAWYFQKKSPDAVQAAIRWDPHNAQYYDALATMRHFYADADNPDEQVKLYQRAVSLNPQNALYWADLGTAFDWAGNRSEALRAFERSEELFPDSPDVNWKLANFYVRSGKTLEGLHALRKVLAGGGVAQQDVFTLAERAIEDKKTILEEMVPPETPMLFGYLNYQASGGDMPAAEQAWTKLMALKLPFELPESFFYLDALIQKQQTEQLAEAWSALGERFPERVGSLRVTPSLVTNGSFESDILNGGLDWRVVPIEGAAISIDSGDAVDGARAVRIQFDGTQNVDYGHLFQYVLVRPNTRYRFSGYMRTAAITTDSGPRFQILDAYDAGKLFAATENAIGTSGWREQRLEFRTPLNTRLIVLRVARPASRKFDNKIHGTMWVDKISLRAAD
jgi:tetratricopeptide (TPR) repeat protein